MPCKALKNLHFQSKSMEKTKQNRLFCGVFTFQPIPGAHKPQSLSFLNFNLKLHISTSIHAIIAPSLRHHPKPSADNLGNQRRPNPRPTRPRSHPRLRQDHPRLMLPFRGIPGCATFFGRPPDKPPPNPPMYSEGVRRPKPGLGRDIVFPAGNHSARHPALGSYGLDCRHTLF